MKRQLISIILLVGLVSSTLLSGCSSDNHSPDQVTTNDGALKSIEPIGRVPDSFKNVIENNLFHGITAFDGRLLKTNVLSKDKDNRTHVQKVQMMDEYGNELASYSCSSADAYHITTLTATDDGGFLFVLGFRDYAYNQNSWASDNGFASRIIKCDKDGNLQFDLPFDQVEGYALQFCIEDNGHFYFFGTIQTPETKIQGVGSPTDISMVILDKNGKVLKTQYISGSDYDRLHAAEITDHGFILSISAQSDDGDFTGSDSNGYPVDWVFTVNENLEIIEKNKISGRDYFDVKIGEKDGAPLYKSSTLLNGFDAGVPDAFIDYGDFYLIVSENNTGINENTPPQISSIWYYTETVYSAYDYTGKILFRASVDSSPNYDYAV